jgi:hypothetical protein
LHFEVCCTVLPTRAYRENVLVAVGYAGCAVQLTAPPPNTRAFEIFQEGATSKSVDGPGRLVGQLTTALSRARKTLLCLQQSFRRNGSSYSRKVRNTRGCYSEVGCMSRTAFRICNGGKPCHRRMSTTFYQWSGSGNPVATALLRLN